MFTPQAAPPIKVTASRTYLEDVREATIRYQALVASGYSRTWIEERVGGELPIYRMRDGLVSPDLLPGLRALWCATGQRVATRAQVSDTNRHRATGAAADNGWLPMAAWDEDRRGRLVCYDDTVAQRGVRSPITQASELRLRLLAAVLRDPWTPLGQLMSNERIPNGANRVTKGARFSRLRYDCTFNGHSLMPPYVISRPWPYPQVRRELLTLLESVNARELTAEEADEAALRIISELPAEPPPVPVPTGRTARLKPTRTEVNGDTLAA